MPLNGSKSTVVVGRSAGRTSLLLAAAILAGCAQPEEDVNATIAAFDRLKPISIAQLTAREWNVLEAVFRYQFSMIPEERRTRARFFALSVGLHDDLPAAFLLRFKGHTPAVVTSSQTPPSEDKHDTILFVAGKLRWRSRTTVEVDGNVIFGPLAGEGGIYTVVNKGDDKWEVVNYREIRVY